MDLYTIFDVRKQQRNKNSFYFCISFAFFTEFLYFTQACDIVAIGKPER